ncbi:MAG TPA: MFS transporter [Clostridia bacterium]|nr:MFS transporter [Clostridia bacterium]
MGKKRIALITVAISFSYAAGYVAKTVLSGIMPLIVEVGVFTKKDLGAMGSAFMLAYGFGQLVNGIIGDILNPKRLIMAGLIGGGLVTFFFPYVQYASLAIFLWGLCGFFCSTLWGPLSKIVAENMETRIARILMLFLTAASITGSMLAYVVCAVVSNWETAFFVSGIYMIATSVLWYLIITLLEKRKQISYKTKRDKLLEGQKGLGINARYLVNHAIIPVTIAIMLNSIIRNAASFWIPTYIKEAFEVKASFSSAIIIVLPIVNLVGTIISYKMLPLFKENEHTLSACLFGFSSIMFILILLLGNVMSIAITAMFLASAAMSGVCNLLFSVYVLRFSKTGRTSGIAGSLDFAAYMMASLANTLIGFWVEKFGWSFVILTWCIATVAGIAASVVSHRLVANKDFNIHQ